MVITRQPPAVISIHAPRAGSDRARPAPRPPSTEFQSTLPVRGATYTPHCRLYCRAFQSTLPVRGATLPSHHVKGDNHDFNPRPPCGGRPEAEATRSLIQAFQSTPPVRGATRTGKVSRRVYTDFNPRPPCGGRPTMPPQYPAKLTISIHAPRAGGDSAKARPFLACNTFQSTPPVRGATYVKSDSVPAEKFQSTPPVRGATSTLIPP